MTLEYRRFSDITPDFVRLTDDLDRELHQKKGESQQAYQGFNKLDGIRDVVLAYYGDEAVGCASFKVRGEGTAEVKRVYVRPEARGRGVSKGLMADLELLARSRGYQALLVETSRDFSEAVGLYRTTGYRVIDNYPPYEKMTDSICFEKKLVPDWIFCDLDGTLLRTDKTISIETEQTLAAVRALGHRLVLATARPLRAVLRLLPESFHQDWLLCGNGARCVRNGVILWDETIPGSVVRTLMQSLVATVPGVRFGREAKDALTINCGDWVHSQGDVFSTDPGLADQTVDANKLLVAVEPSTVEAVKALVPLNLSAVVTDGGTLLQIMPTGVNKGSAALRLMEKEGNGSGTSVCFGDDLNDIALFEACTWPVALENSVEALKHLAKATTSSHEDDGVAVYLKQRYLGGTL